MIEVADIFHCRTGLFGGELWRCTACSKERYVYHSCCNRHCPKCGGKSARKWLKSQSRLKLPCSYFLFTFTLTPKAMQRWKRCPRRRNPVLTVARKPWCSWPRSIDPAAVPRGINSIFNRKNTSNESNRNSCVQNQRIATQRKEKSPEIVSSATKKAKHLKGRERVA